MQHERSTFITEILRQSYEEDEVQTASFESFDVKDAVVWIDPLDGTWQFVDG